MARIFTATHGPEDWKAHPGNPERPRGKDFAAFGARLAAAVGPDDIGRRRLTCGTDLMRGRAAGDQRLRATLDAEAG